MTQQYTVIHYEENGKDIFQDWLDGIKDLRGRNAIQKAIDHMEDGHFGVHKSCRNGVWKLILDTGPGYRVYYSIVEKVVILLLCAGQKRTQQKDIDKAIEYLKEFKERN